MKTCKLELQSRQYCYATVIGGVVMAGGAALSASQDTTGGATVPKPAMYQPVDLGESQMDTVADNLEALPQIQYLVEGTNTHITSEAKRRINAFYPGFRQAIKSYAGAGQSLLNGQLPFQDVMDIVGNRNALGASIGTPGTSGPATMRDLGMSQLQGLQMGGGIMKDLVGIAETVSPIARYMTPQTMFMDPTTRANMDIQQAQLIQQSQQNANNLAAMGDPQAAAQAQTISGIGGQLSGIGQSLLGGGFGSTGGAAPSTNAMGEMQYLTGTVPRATPVYYNGSLG